MLSMRIVSGLVFFTLIFVGIFVPHMEFLLLLLLLFGTLMGIHEFLHFGIEKPVTFLLWLTLGAGALMLINAWDTRYGYEYSFVIISLTTVIAMAYMTWTTYPNVMEQIASVAAALIYVALPLSLILAIWRQAVSAGTDSPQHYIIFLVLVTWASDIGAFFTGRFFGKHKLAPRISPGKTVEGFLGGIVFTLIVAAVMKLTWNNIGRIFGWGEVLTLAFLFSIIAPWGDLAESRIKRSRGIKDSGRTFTGHGGMLDIIDSLLFTTIFYYAYLKFFRDFELF